MSYICKKDRIFYEVGDGGSPRPRTAGRIKTINSDTDARAWDLNEQTRRQHLLEILNNPGQHSNLGTLLPIEFLAETFNTNRNSEIEDLKRTIQNLEKKLSAYAKINLTTDQAEIINLLNVEDSNVVEENPASYGVSPLSSTWENFNQALGLLQQQKSYLDNGVDPIEELQERHSKIPTRGCRCIKPSTSKSTAVNTVDVDTSERESGLSKESLIETLIEKDSKIIVLEYEISALKMEMDEGIVDSSEHLDKEELAAELGRAKSKISKLKSEIANTKANRKEEMKLFKSELEALKEATKNGTDETELCAKLRKENQELEQKYHALEDRYNETISKRKLADGSNRELEHLNSSLRCINSELEMKIENLSIANKDLEARLMSVGTEKNAIRRDNRRLKEQLSTSTAEHQALKKAHTELTKAHNDLKKQREKMHEKSTDVAFQKLKTENASLTSELVKASQKLNNKDLECQLAKSEGLAKEKSQENMINQLRIELKALKNTISETKTQIGSLEAKLSEARDENQTLKTQKQALNEELNKVKNNLVNEKKQRESVKENFVNLKNEFDEFISKYEGAIKERDSLLVKFNTMPSPWENQGQIRFKDSEIEMLRLECERYKRRVKDLEKVERDFGALAEKTRDYDAVRSESHFYKEKFMGCHSEKLEMESKLHETRMEIKSLVSKLQSVSEARDIQQLKSSEILNELRAELEQKDSKLLSYKEKLIEFDRIKEEIQDLQEQLVKTIESTSEHQEEVLKKTTTTVKSEYTKIIQQLKKSNKELLKVNLNLQKERSCGCLAKAKACEKTASEIDGVFRKPNTDPEEGRVYEQMEALVKRNIAIQAEIRVLSNLLQCYANKGRSIKDFSKHIEEISKKNEETKAVVRTIFSEIIISPDFNPRIASASQIPKVAAQQTNDEIQALITSKQAYFNKYLKPLVNNRSKMYIFVKVVEFTIAEIEEYKLSLKNLTVLELLEQLEERLCNLATQMTQKEQVSDDILSFGSSTSTTYFAGKPLTTSRSEIYVSVKLIEFIIAELEESKLALKDPEDVLRLEKLEEKLGVLAIEMSKDMSVENLERQENRQSNVEIQTSSDWVTENQDFEKYLKPLARNRSVNYIFVQLIKFALAKIQEHKVQNTEVKVVLEKLENLAAELSQQISFGTHQLVSDQSRRLSVSSTLRTVSISQHLRSDNSRSSTLRTMSICNCKLKHPQLLIESRNQQLQRLSVFLHHTFENTLHDEKKHGRSSTTLVIKPNESKTSNDINEEPGNSIENPKEVTVIEMLSQPSNPLKSLVNNQSGFEDVKPTGPELIQLKEIASTQLGSDSSSSEIESQNPTNDFPNIAPDPKNATSESEIEDHHNVSSIKESKSVGTIPIEIPMLDCGCVPPCESDERLFMPTERERAQLKCDGSKITTDNDCNSKSVSSGSSTEEEKVTDEIRVTSNSSSHSCKSISTELLTSEETNQEEDSKEARNEVMQMLEGLSNQLLVMIGKHKEAESSITSDSGDVSILNNELLRRSSFGPICGSRDSEASLTALHSEQKLLKDQNEEDNMANASPAESFINLTDSGNLDAIFEADESATEKTIDFGVQVNVDEVTEIDTRLEEATSTTGLGIEIVTRSFGTQHGQLEVGTSDQETSTEADSHSFKSSSSSTMFDNVLAIKTLQEKFLEELQKSNEHNDVQSLEREIDLLEEKNATLQDENDKLLQKVETLSVAEAELSSLQAENNHLRTKLEELGIQAAELELLEKKYMKLQIQTEGLEQKLQATKESPRSFNDVQTLTDPELNTELAKKGEEINFFKDENERLKCLVTDLKIEKKKFEDQINKSLEEVQEIRMPRPENGLDSNFIYEEIKRLQMENVAISAEVKRWKGFAESIKCLLDSKSLKMHELCAIERKNLKKALKESEEKLQKLANVSNENIGLLKKQFDRDLKNLLSKHNDSVSQLQQMHEEAINQISKEYETENECLRDAVKELREIIKRKRLPEAEKYDKPEKQEKFCSLQKFLTPTASKNLGSSFGTTDLVRPNFRTKELSPNLSDIVDKIVCQGIEHLTIQELSSLHTRTCQATKVKLQSRDKVKNMLTDEEKYLNRLHGLEETLMKRQKDAILKVKALEKVIQKEKRRISSGQIGTIDKKEDLTDSDSDNQKREKNESHIPPDCTCCVCPGKSTHKSGPGSP